MGEGSLGRDYWGAITGVHGMRERVVVCIKGRGMREDKCGVGVRGIGKGRDVKKKGRGGSWSV